MEKLLIGLDFGSDSVRAVLVAANGEQLATSVHEYARWAQGKYCDPAANQFRQHPLDYLEGTEAVIRNVLKGVDATRVAGIAAEMGNLYYHLMVMMVCKGIAPQLLGDALDKRNGKTGNLKQFHTTDQNS